MHRIRDNRLNVNNDFINICKFICKNYWNLQKEFADINNLLDTTEIYGIAYFEKSMVAMHVKASKLKCNNETLKILLNMVRKVKEEAKLEFVQHVDFADIYNVILEEITKGNIVTFVWKVRKILQYIIYQIDRIVNTDDVNKQVAILKGMMAYY